MALRDLKARIAADLAARIEAGSLCVGGELLPPSPARIKIVGKSRDNLQARITYNDRAPYYLRVSEES